MTTIESKDSRALDERGLMTGLLGEPAESRTTTATLRSVGPDAPGQAARGVDRPARGARAERAGAVSGSAGHAAHWAESAGQGGAGQARAAPAGERPVGGVGPDLVGPAGSAPAPTPPASSPSATWWRSTTARSPCWSGRSTASSRTTPATRPSRPSPVSGRTIAAIMVAEIGDVSRFA